MIARVRGRIKLSALGLRRVEARYQPQRTAEKICENLRESVVKTEIAFSSPGSIQESRNDKRRVFPPDLPSIAITDLEEAL
jgi:hypothetical protein